MKMRDQTLWTWHIFAGLVILVLLGLHMGIMHLYTLLNLFNPAGGHPVDWANVMARSQSVFFMVSYIILLAAALFHGLYGLRNILFELSLSTGLKKAVNVLFLLGGLGLFVLGTWAAITANRLPPIT